VVEAGQTIIVSPAAGRSNCGVYCWIGRSHGVTVSDGRRSIVVDHKRWRPPPVALPVQTQAHDDNKAQRRMPPTVQRNPTLVEFFTYASFANMYVPVMMPDGRRRTGAVPSRNMPDLLNACFLWIDSNLTFA